MSENTTQKFQGITLVTRPSQKLLNERQRVDYADQQRKLVKWLLTVGRDPKRARGYAHATVKAGIYQIDRFYRFVWTDLEDGYTTAITHDHGNRYLQELAFEDFKNSYKARLYKSLRMLYKWREYALGDESWDPEITFYDRDSASNPKEYFYKEERMKLREAALEYGSIPGYRSVTPDERSKWKAHLAQRFEKPKSEVTLDDWKRANGWKYPSLLWTTLDTGLRPCEIERSSIDWIDVENGVLQIPKQDSSKNRDNWTPALTERTTEALKRWLQEREQYKKYANSDAIWLTREGNPYNTNSLNYLLRRVCELADIKYRSWYAIRHSVGTYMTREEDLAATQAQLRHKDERTTMRYDQTPVEDRKKALDRMG